MTLVTNNELKLWHQILPGCKTVFDVGVRNDTDIMELFPDITFHVFEPNPSSFRSLSGKTQHLRNVIANNFALGNTNGKLLYYSDTESIVCRTHHTRSTAVPYEIDVVRLDDYCKQRSVHQIDFMKVDVEGFELEVMKGAENMINGSCRYIQFEYGGTYLDTDIKLRDIYSFLRGWKFYRITDTEIEYAPAVREDYAFCNYLAVKGDIQTLHNLTTEDEREGAIGSKSTDGSANSRPDVKNGGTVASTGAHTLQFQNVILPTGSLWPDFLREMVQLFGLKVLVETGTFDENTSFAASDIFEQIYTIMPGVKQYEKMEQHFGANHNVRVIHGDPVGILPQILADSNINILIRLHDRCDEKADEEDTSGTAIIEELRVIRDAGINNTLILIDNLRYFDKAWNRTSNDVGTHDYPRASALCDAIMDIDKSFRFAVYGDVLVAFPDRDTITLSPVLAACTLSRLYEGNIGETENIIEAEQAIMAAADEELSTIQSLHAQYVDSERYGFGRHYRLWFALTLMGQIKYMQACKELLASIILGLEHWRVHWYLAKTAYDAEYFSLSKKSIRKVRDIAPDFEGGRLLDSLLTEISDDDTREKRFSLQDHLELAIHLINSGREDEASAQLDEVSSYVGNKTEIYREYARLLLKLGKNDSAIDLLDRAAKTDPNNSNLHNDIGVGYFQKGDYGKAMEYFGLALSKNDQNFQALRNVLILSHQLGTIIEASVVLRGILDKYPDNPTLAGIAQEFLNLTKMDAMQRNFEQFLKNINGSSIRRHDDILLWAENCDKNASRLEDPKCYEEYESEIVRNGYVLSQEVKSNYRDRYAGLSDLRILIQIPPLNVSPGGYSLFTNMLQALSYIGIKVAALGWEEPVEKALERFKPTVLMTSDHELYLSRINWDAVKKYRDRATLRIGLTASLQEYGNTPLWGRLNWAKQHNVDFFYSFRSPEYLNQRKEYQPFYNSGYKIFSIEFAANPLIHYPVPNIEKDIDFIFLASSNRDKWPRYFEYLSKITSQYTGFIDGPGWGFQLQTSTLNKDRYLYARSRVGLNLHLTEQIEWPCELNERTYILAACGIPQLIDGALLLPRRFDEGGFFVANSPEEYNSHFDFMMENPDEATRRALIAQKEVFSFHTWFHRAERLSLDLIQEFFAGKGHGLLYGTGLFEKVNSKIHGRTARVGGALNQLLQYENCDVEDINLLDGGFGIADEHSIIADMHDAYKDAALINRYDCIVSSNVIEHSFNPIFLLLNYYLVTRRDGYQFHAIPNYRYTYDIYRKPTTLEHFFQDFEGMVDARDLTHRDDYIQSAVQKHGWQRKFHEKYPVQYPFMHFHVFDEHNTKALLESVFQDVTIDLIRTKDFSDNVVLFRNELNPEFVARYGYLIKKYSELFLLHSNGSAHGDVQANIGHEKTPLHVHSRSRDKSNLDAKADKQDDTPKGLAAVVFSKDRAMQLDCTLRTFFKHCQDAGDVHLKVIYKASSDQHRKQYADLINRFPSVQFLSENHFKNDLLLLMQPYRHVMFVVDDNVFVDDFSTRDIIQYLDNNRNALGFSLRLGRNASYCYMLNKPQSFPPFKHQNGRALRFDWPSAELDFGYPLELSSSLYRIEDIMPLLTEGDFSNPNTLEMFLDSRKATFSKNKKELLCFETSVSFCNPVNMVQTMWTNKAGGNPLCSPDALADLYGRGFRIDIEQFSGFVPNSCHQEIELQFTDKSGETVNADLPISQPLASIVILSYNGVDHIRACIESVRRNTIQDYEIIVVDNAREDGSREYLKSLGDIILIENEVNRGPAVARAQAMSVACGKYMAFLDDDTIVTREWLTKFIQIAESYPNIGMLGAVSNYASGYQLVENTRYNNLDELEDFARKHYESNRGRLTLTTRLVSFCLFITRAVADKIGTFDSRFGLFGFEDDDYSLRAYIAGMNPSVAHEVFIHHTGGPQGRGNEAYNKRLQEAWRIFKDKWEIPKDVPYGGSFDMSIISNQLFNKDKHFVPIPAKSDEEIEFNTAFARATESAQQGNLDDAIAIFSDLLVKNPGSGIVHAALGTLFCGKGEHEKARDALTKALEMMPSEIGLYLQLAEVYIQMNESADAQKMLEAVLSREPFNIEAMANLVDILVASDRTGEAVEKVKNALLEYPQNPDLIAIFGHLAAVIGNREALEVCIAKLRDIDPSHNAINKLERILDPGRDDTTANDEPGGTHAPHGSRIPLAFVKLRDYSLDPEFLKTIQKTFHTDVLIETGTFMGSTALNASELFREVHTVELSENLFNQACARFQNIGNIKAYNGDSAVVLPGIIEKIDGKALFWLDGHYSGEGTAMTDKDTPIIEEIKAIARSGMEDPVIIVDDIRLFLEPDTASSSTPNGYPPLTEVCRLIKTINSGYQCVVFGDVLIAYNSREQFFSPTVQACTVSRLYDGTNYDEETLFKAEDTVRLAQGSERSAIEALYSVFMSDSPASGYYRLWLALTRMGTGNYAEAIETILGGIKNGFYHWRLSLYLAEGYLKTGQLELAHTTISKALDQAPQSSYVRKFNDIIPETHPAPVETEASRQFRKDVEEYQRLLEGTEKRFSINPQELLYLNDRTTTHTFDPHYILHTSWAARVLAATKPDNHVDISSSIYFSSIVSAFIPVTFYDYRPAPLSLSGFQSHSADVTMLPFPDDSINSLSCMHVVEHIGLGRYGDPIDPDGDLKAINELKRVVKPGGRLLFVVPIGKPKLVFNAHRIYSHDQIVRLFDGFAIEEFSLIPDTMQNGTWTLLEGSREISDQQTYGCGCFLFAKSEDPKQKQHDETADSKSVETKHINTGLTSVVIPVTGFHDNLKRCIESINANAEEPCEVIMIVKGSPKIPAWFKKLNSTNHRNVIAHTSKDADFSFMCNEGLKKATGHYILILDENTVLLKDTLKTMVRHLEKNQTRGIVAPMSNHAIGPQKIPDTQDMSLTDFQEYVTTFSERNRYRFAETFETDAFCVLLKKEIVDAIGSFDEDIKTPFFAMNDYRLNTLLHGHTSIVAADTAVFRQHVRSAEKGRDKIFHKKWDKFDPYSETGKTLSPFVAIKNARELYGKGLLRESISAIMEGIQHTPENGTLYYCLADILLDAKEFEQSMEAVESLPEKERNSIRALEILGYCSYHLGDIEKAQEYANRVLSFSADSVKAVNLKGLLASKQGDPDTAEALFRQAIASEPSFADAYMNMGVIKWQNNNNGEALDLIEKGFVLSPETEDFSTTYHSAVVSLNEFPRAERVFQEAVGLFPKNRKLTFLHVAVLLQQHKYNEAMEKIEDAMSAFGIDDEILAAALAVRQNIGADVIDGSKKKTGTLSVCMIVKNEEKHILRCLASLKPVADEIIVVDTGSTDRTRDISTAFGASVYDFPWTNDFSEARNVSLEKAKGDWILVHDADEVLSTLDHDDLRKILMKKHSKPIAYEITTRNYILEPATDGWVGNAREYREEEAGTGWFPSAKVRLFTNDKRIRFCNPVHELLEPSIMNAGIEIKPCSIPIHHYGKLPSDKSAKKGDEYYLLGKQKLKHMGNVPIALRELAIQAEELGKHDEAIEHWRAYAQAIPDRALPYFNMATIYMEMDQFEQAFNSARKAYDIEPGKKETVLTYSTTSLCAGDVFEVVRILETFIESVDYPPAEVVLAAGYCVTGRQEEGVALMAKIKEKGYNCKPALRVLSKKLISAGRAEQAISLLQSVLESDNTDAETIALLEDYRKNINAME